MTRWRQFLDAVRAYPPGMHEINEPCSEEAIVSAEASLGRMPIELREMLAHFNGGEFFIDAIPMVTLFGISAADQRLPPALDLVAHSSPWRRANQGSEEWVAGTSNYGGLLVVQPNGVIKEWDSSLRKWTGQIWSFDDWQRETLTQGAEYVGG